MAATPEERAALTNAVLKVLADNGDQATLAETEAMAAELLERRAAPTPDAVERVARATEALSIAVETRVKMQHHIIRAGRERAHCIYHNVYVREDGRCHAIDDIAESIMEARAAIAAMRPASAWMRWGSR